MNVVQVANLTADDPPPNERKFSLANSVPTNTIERSSGLGVSATLLRRL